MISFEYETGYFVEFFFCYIFFLLLRTTSNKASAHAWMDKPCVSMVYFAKLIIVSIVYIYVCTCSCFEC
jgi:hypothetical protein